MMWKKDNQIVKNVCRCGICKHSADLVNRSFYQCQKNKNHLGVTFVGIFTNMSRIPLKIKEIKWLHGFGG